MFSYFTTQILIHGPSSQMIIGTADAPFQHRVTLTLTGRRRDDILPLAPGLILGSKTLGVFGNVSGSSILLLSIYLCYSSFCFRYQCMVDHVR